MIIWTKDYQEYLRWSLYHGMLSEQIAPMWMYDYNVNFDEVESALFGLWFCEVKK
jgi:hypothetical protein